MIEIGVSHLAVGELGALQPRPRHRQHLARQIDADGPPGQRRQDLQHAPGAGADIQEGGRRLPARQLDQHAFHLAVGDVQRA